MITIKTDEEIKKLRIAGEVVGKTHKYLQQFLKPGITTKEIDKLAEEYIISQGCTPSFKGLYGFPGSICISINEEVVHGIPSSRKLQNGDILKLDIGASYEGYHGDSAWSYLIGDGSDKDKKLLQHTEEALMAGLSAIHNGCHVGDIGHAISKVAHKYNLGIVRELVGHGVGSAVHEDPDVPNYGNKGNGPVLKTGMVIAVEPMLNQGTATIYMLDDEWTIITGDDKNSAHFEHTILVTDTGYEILTKRDVEV
ncbi:MAG: type I methionyl aminopeptidase [Bacilli bacterium]